MKRFITNLAIVLIFPFVGLCCFLLFVQLYPGYVDSYYGRFCSPKQNSLILGTSLAAQGIEPDIINEKLGHLYHLPIFNYSFSIDKSPYGETYLESIKKKLNTDVTNGLFIIDVEPDAIATIENMGDLHGKDTRENQTCITIKNVNSKYFNINFQYLKSSVFFDRIVLIKRISKNIFADDELHSIYIKDNGRLIVDSNSKIDSLQVKEDNIQRNNMINEWYKDSYLSKYRDSCLCATIEYLKQHGTVILISMPTSKELVELQQNYFPDFDKRIQEISTKYKVPYFSFKNSFDKYQTRDGSHLYKDSGDQFTSDLCDSILIYTSTLKI